MSDPLPSLAEVFKDVERFVLIDGEPWAVLKGRPGEAFRVDPQLCPFIGGPKPAEQAPPAENEPLLQRIEALVARVEELERKR